MVLLFVWDISLEHACPEHFQWLFAFVFLEDSYLFPELITGDLCRYLLTAVLSMSSRPSDILELPTSEHCIELDAVINGLFGL